MRIVFAVICLMWLPILALTQAQAEVLRLEIDKGVVEPLPFAAPVFQAETPGANQLAQQITDLVIQDLQGTGLFRGINRAAFLSTVDNFNAPISFPDWRTINAQALITGAVATGQGGRVTVKFRLYDVFAGTELGDGLQLAGTKEGWRRIAHKVADTVYERITGETGYFDSRVVFVAESGPKDNRSKRLAIMDYDGAGVQFLTSANDLVLAPRFSPQGDQVLYTSYASGFPRIHVLRIADASQRALEVTEGTMSFSPRFSPDGRTVVFSLERSGNSDLYALDVASGARQRLTATPAIETAPSYNPDGSRIVFESDRSGSQQLYIMPSAGGAAERISFGKGRYGTPVWSPRGDYIAFTKQAGGRFHIGVMRPDGTGERLLTASFLDESPTWSPNGRVIMFTRETQGPNGAPALYTVDLSGRNLRKLRISTPGSDPSWSPLQR
ncbi:MAG: Tol-Pal system beta propeller repeat protein TolB [Pseudomonadota bacterium]